MNLKKFVAIVPVVALAVGVGVYAGRGDDTRLVQAAGDSAPAQLVESSTTTEGPSPTSTTVEPPSGSQQTTSTTSDLAAKVQQHDQKLVNHEKRITNLESTTTTTTAVVVTTVPTVPVTAEPSTTTSTTSITPPPKPATSTTTVPPSQPTSPAPECRLVIGYAGNDQWNGRLHSNQPGRWAHIYIGAGANSSTEDVLLDAWGEDPFSIRGVSQNQSWLVTVSFDGVEACRQSYQP